MPVRQSSNQLMEGIYSTPLLSRSVIRNVAPKTHTSARKKFLINENLYQTSSEATATFRRGGNYSKQEKI